MGMWCGDYAWVKGYPQKIAEGKVFFILTDPYGKRTVIEKHLNNRFEKLIYDSTLFDYRKLEPREKLGWSSEEIDTDRFLLRDRDHTPVLIEQHHFIEDKPRTCHYFSPHLLPLGHQKISYTTLGDPFNGVTLYDSLDKVVLVKKYALLPDGSFGNLLES